MHTLQNSILKDQMNHIPEWSPAMLEDICEAT